MRSPIMSKQSSMKLDVEVPLKPTIKDIDSIKPRSSDTMAKPSRNTSSKRQSNPESTFSKLDSLNKTMI